MKKQHILGLIAAGITALIIVFNIYTIAESGPEKVTDIVKHWTIAWMKGGIIAVVVGFIIFQINKHISSEQTMSLVGVIIFTPLVPFLSTTFFGYHLAMIILASIVGLIIGYFCYIIDDHLLELWEVRHITIPLVFGLGFGGSVIIACLYENWQDENVYVNNHSTCTELTVERYTSHTSCSKKGGCHTTYSWSYHKSYYYFQEGHDYKNPIENVDYTLGYGALGYKDRVKMNHHDWIGCVAYKKHGPVAKWIYLTDVNLEYQENKWYEVEENFFGQAIKSGKPIHAQGSPPQTRVTKLPTSDNVPGMFTLTIQFFKIMAIHEDFALLRWVYALVYLPFLVLILFVAEYRISFIVLVASSTIIIMIILAIISSRNGERLSDRSFGGFGGGSFGGGGAGGRW